MSQDDDVINKDYIILLNGLSYTIYAHETLFRIINSIIFEFSIII